MPGSGDDPHSSTDFYKSFLFEWQFAMLLLGTHYRKITFFFAAAILGTIFGV
jgi:hypothetical protein